MQRFVLCFLICFNSMAWGDSPSGCDPAALEALAYNIGINPKLLRDLGAEPTFQKKTFQYVLTIHFAESEQAPAFIKDLARRVKSHASPFDEKSARRLIDRVADERNIQIPSAVREQMAQTLSRDGERMAQGGNYLAGDELQLQMREEAANDLGQLSVKFVNTELNRGAAENKRIPDRSEAELELLGLQAIADNLPGIPHPAHAKSFNKYMEELKKKNVGLWKIAVPQIHAVLLAMATGEDVSKYRGKAIRGGLVEISLGSSAHRILVTHGESGQPPVILNWGDVKGGAHNQQTMFIEEARDRARTLRPRK